MELKLAELIDGKPYCPECGEPTPPRNPAMQPRPHVCACGQSVANHPAAVRAMEKAKEPQ